MASGVRRIEATCGKLSLEGMERSQGVLHQAAQFLKTAPAGLLERMEQQANEMKQLRQALDKFKAEASLGEAKQFLASAKTVSGLHVITTTRTGMDAAAMRTMGDFLRDKDPSVVAVIASINGEKVILPGRVRQGGRGPGHQGRRPGPGRVRRVRRQGRRQARFRHGRRHRIAEGGRRPGFRGRFCVGKALLKPGEWK